MEGSPVNERSDRDAHSSAPPRVKVRNRKQVEAEERAREAQKLQSWRKAEALAVATWTRLSPEELRSSGGNANKIAGLIQLRYQTTREDSDKQVAAFMTAHVSPA
jgi:hypothetical protein